jgi:tetratricopeptide (TPR) repeat protein
MVYAMNSVGKEFTYFDTDITVPATDGGPILSTPVIGYKTEDNLTNFFFTYKFNRKKLFVDTEQNFRLKEKPTVSLGIYNLGRDLWENGAVELDLRALNERRPFQKKMDLPLSNYPFSKDMNILYQIPEELNADYYILDVKLKDKAGKKLDTRRLEFSVSPVRTFSYPMETFKQSLALNPYFFYFTLGSQHQKVGALRKAEDYLNRAITAKPDFLQGYVSYCHVLNKLKKYDKVLEVAEKLKGDSNLAFEYHLIRATAMYGQSKFKEALDDLEKANRIYDSDVRVLNLLGFTFLNLKNYNEALKAFRVSLQLNKNQPLIVKTIAEVNKRTSATEK